MEKLIDNREQRLKTNMFAFVGTQYVDANSTFCSYAKPSIFSGLALVSTFTINYFNELRCTNSYFDNNYFSRSLFPLGSIVKNEFRLKGKAYNYSAELKVSNNRFF